MRKQSSDCLLWTAARAAEVTCHKSQISDRARRLMIEEKLLSFFVEFFNLGERGLWILRYPPKLVITCSWLDCVSARRAADPLTSKGRSASESLSSFGQPFVLFGLFQKALREYEAQEERVHSWFISQIKESLWQLAVDSRRRAE